MLLSHCTTCRQHVQVIAEKNAIVCILTVPAVICAVNIHAVSIFKDIYIALFTIFSRISQEQKNKPVHCRPAMNRYCTQIRKSLHDKPERCACETHPAAARTNAVWR